MSDGVVSSVTTPLFIKQRKKPIGMIEIFADGRIDGAIDDEFTTELILHLFLVGLANGIEIDTMKTMIVRETEDGS